MAKEWTEMTPEEKREVRFKRWLDAENVQFVSLDMILADLARVVDGEVIEYDPDC